MILFLINIAGSAALLIWAVRLLRTGVERAYSVQLRAVLRRSNSNRWQAAGSGVIAALCLQSATAVAVLLSNFAGKGGVGLWAGIAILLGADIGSAIVSQVLLVRQDILIPLLLLIGVVLFLRSSRNELRQLGRILIAIALIFVSLDMIRSATAPLTDSTAAANVMAYLGGDAVTSFLIGALFAWAVHSSVAAVLFFVTLTAQGLLPASGAAAMILGANAGGAFLAYVLTLTASPTARRVVIANLGLRGGGAALLLLLMTQGIFDLTWLGDNASRQAINLHLAFNIGLALFCLPFLGWIVRGIEMLFPHRTQPTSSEVHASALDPTTLDRPDRALNCAAREILKVGEQAEFMLRSVMRLFEEWDDALVKTMDEKAQLVRSMHEDIKRFLAQVNRGELQDAQRERASELANIAYNLETAADAIGYGLVDQLRQLRAEKVAFSADGLADIRDFHDRVLTNAQLGLSVLMHGAPDAARQLLRAKEKVRTVEKTLQERHLERLRAGVEASFATSRMHQESLRILKNVNTAFATIGYPIASKSGDLLSTRLSDKSNANDGFLTNARN